MRRLLALLLAACFLPLIASSAQAAPPDQFPSRIDLPDGFQPEGIEAGRGTTVYVGSLRDGAIWRGDLRTGVGDPTWAAPVGVPTVGLAYDRWHDLLWAAGGPSGQVRAYDAVSGDLVRTYTVAPAPTGFLNDVTVTRSGVYVTDSNIQQLVVVPFGSDGSLPMTATTRPITGEFVYGPGFNANGIVNARGYLILVQSSLGRLFRVDPATGQSVEIDTGGTNLVNGDGMELVGSTLYVVRNRDNLIVRLQLGPGLLTAQPTGELTGATDVPTTATFAAGHLYVVNARFGNASPTTADYWITRLS